MNPNTTFTDASRRGKAGPRAAAPTARSFRRAYQAVAAAAVLVLGPGGRLSDARADSLPAKPARSPSKARPYLSPVREPALLPAREPVRNLAPTADNEAERRLQADLDALVQGPALKQAINGVLVFDVPSGRTLYSYGATRQLNPASNVKLVSTAAALRVLGPDFAYTTRLVGAAPDTRGVVRGPVHFVGTGDPTLRYRDLLELGVALRARGVVTIEGPLVVGPDNLRNSVPHPGFRIHLGRTQPGERPAVTVAPELNVALDNRAVARGRRARLRLAASLIADPVGESPQWRLEIAGTVRPGQAARRFVDVHDGALFTTLAMVEALRQAGVVVSGSVRVSSEHPAGNILAEHRSQPLGVIVAKINKPSSNFLADRVIMTAGEVALGGYPDLANGVRVMQDFLAQLAIEPGSYRLDNGSGLSYTNHLSAQQVAAVLTALDEDFSLAPEFVASLTVAARDGTLRRRFRQDPAQGRVRGKTGTLNGVAALSGFVAAGPEHKLGFVLLSNGFARRRLGTVRSGHTAIVNTLYGFLVRDVAPSSRDNPPRDVSRADKTHTPE